MCTLLLINVYLDSVANAKPFIKCLQRMRTQWECPYYLHGFLGLGLGRAPIPRRMP